MGPLPQDIDVSFNAMTLTQPLERFRPDLIECQDAYNLPWAAIAHRKRFPDAALVAAYMTDFPTVYVERPFAKVVGKPLAGVASRLCYAYCASLYRRFDAVYALGEHGGATKLRSLGIDYVDVVPLGVEVGEFAAERPIGQACRLLTHESRAGQAFKARRSAA